MCGMTQAAWGLFRHVPPAPFRIPHSALRIQMVRLQKYLADAGVASRRAGEQIILAGRVAVNGETVAALGTRIDPDHDRVAVDGKPVRAKRKLYVALNKPPGLVCSRKDEHERPTIYGLLPKEWGHLHSVGRLDYPSEGLIFLTNDGEFSLHLTHPRYGVRKKYIATVEGRVTEQVLTGVYAGCVAPGREVEGGEGAAGLGQPGAERGGIGIGPGQEPGSAAAVRVAARHGEAPAAGPDRQDQAGRAAGGQMAGIDRTGN